MRRALFTAQDPKSLRQAFDKLKPNRELRPLYEAAVARQQADQIFNLSLTRTATQDAARARREGRHRHRPGQDADARHRLPARIEIRDFRAEDYFEIVATANVEGGSFLMRHAPPRQARIKKRAEAEAIAAAAGGYRGPARRHGRDNAGRRRRVSSICRRLQKTCGQRWGWTADKTLVGRAGAL